MSKSSASVALMSVGAVAIVAGALMYVLPGPGFPFLILGLTLTAAGAALRIAGSR